MLEHEGKSVNGRSHSGAHVDEGTVHAWLDGQLSPEEAARVEAHVGGCETCSGLVAEARGHIAAATRIVNALDGVPTQVSPQARRRSRQWQLRLAAAIVVMAVGTAVLLRESHGRVSPPFEEHAAAPAAGAPSQIVPNASSAPAPAPAPDLERKQQPSRVLAKKVPAAPPVNKPEAKAAPMPSPAAVGGVQQDVNRERDHAEPPAANEALPVPRAMARSSPMSPRSGDTVPEPTIENSLQGKTRDQVATLPALASNARTITGRVVDGEQRAPVPAAQVVIPGTVIGQSTTDSGTFDIAVPADAKSLTVRRMGYLAETVPLKPGTTDYTIALKKDELRLEAQVLTGAATSISSQNAAPAATALAAPQRTAVARQNGVAPGPELRATLAGSQCQGRVVRIPNGAPGSGLSDSTDVRLTPTPTPSLDQPGFVVRFVPDTTTAAPGSWQPIGRDSALVHLQHGPAQGRVSCGDTHP